MPSTHPVILFGGTSSERRVSVASAQHLSAVIPAAELWFWQASDKVFRVEASALANHARPFEIDFAPHVPPLANTLVDALKIAPKGAVFILALHGGTGENGTVQGWLEAQGLCFTGSDAASSARAFNKEGAKKTAAGLGIAVAASSVIQGAGAAQEQHIRSFLKTHGRLVVKPVADGSSVGLVFVNSPDDVPKALAQIGQDPKIAFLMEAFIEGRELTVGVLDGPKGTVALPCSEVVMAKGHTFDYEGKYLGRGSTEITPANIPEAAHKQCGELAVKIHQGLGLRGYSRTDLILTQQGPVYLETNNLPGLTRASFIPQQLAAAKISMTEFVQTQVNLALSGSQARQKA